MGLHDILAALLVLTSLFAFFVSVEQGYHVAKEQPRFIGGTFAHVELVILFLGYRFRQVWRETIHFPSAESTKADVRVEHDCTPERCRRRTER